MKQDQEVNPLNADLNPICHLLALLGAHHILHVSRIRVSSKNDESLERIGWELELNELVRVKYLVILFQNF